MHYIFYSNERDDDQRNKRVEALLDLLKEVTDERAELRASNQYLTKEVVELRILRASNQHLTKEVVELRTTILRKDDVIRNMDQDMQKSAKKIATHI